MAFRHVILLLFVLLQLSSVFLLADAQCTLLFTCKTCVENPTCGWCKETLSCVNGSPSGPLLGTCNGWKYGHCKDS